MKIYLETTDPKARLLLKEAALELTDLTIVESSKSAELVLTAEPSDEEGFTLHRDASAAQIRYRKTSDLGRALCLLVGHAQDERYCASQRCAFREFGFMIDTSRNAVPRVETVKQWIRLALLQGYSFIGLYMEDTYLIDGEPYFGYMRGAYSHAELKEIDAYGVSLGLEVRPYIQTLGHLNQLVRHRDYGGIWDSGSILLVDEPRTYALLDRMIATLTECFTTRTFNIGMDEAHMLGRGRYMDLHGPTDRTELMLRHLNKVMEICRRYGVHAQMWSDMFYSDPYMRYGGKASNADVALLPEDADPVFWYYDETHKDFYDKAFDGQRAMFGKNCHFAGAARRWTGFAPNNRFSFEVGRSALTSAAEHGVVSAILTAWGDNGSESSFFSILPSTWFDAALAYEYLALPEAERADLTPDDAGFTALTGMSFERYMAVDALRWFGHPELSSNADKFLLYNDPLQGIFDSTAGDIELAQHYRTALADLEKTAALGGRFAYLFENLAHLAKVLVLKSDLGIRLTAAYKAGDKARLAAIREEIPEICRRLCAFEQSFRRQWHTENKPFGYEIQSLRLGGLKARLLYVADTLGQYLSGEIPEIAELELTKLPFDLTGDNDVFNMEFNNFANTVSYNIF